MARIFYHADTGNIYGVHPDGNIRVPAGILFIDEVETPDKINWPVMPDGRLGIEQASRVDLASKNLVLRPDGIPPLDPNLELDEALEALPGTATVSDLVSVLRGVSGRAGRIAARPT